MKKIAVLGNNEFALGFQVAGINNVFPIDEKNPDDVILKIREDKDIGLVLLEEDTMKMFSEDIADMMSQSIEPVFLMISQKDSNEEMRKLIKKSIGVDLWDK